MKVCLACKTRFEADSWSCPICNYSVSLIDGFPVFAPTLLQGDGSDAEYPYNELFNLEARNFWFRSRNRLISWAIENHFPKAHSFFEIGCGTGFVISGIQKNFPQLTLSASDVLISGLTYAKERLPTVSVFQMDARKIPFESEFDIIGAFDVLEHIEEDQLALHQIFQATKPNGGIILTVPQHPFLWSYLDDYAHHKRRYTRQELINKVTQAGFEPVYVTSFVSLLLPLMYISRLRQKQDDFDVMREFKIHSFLNMFFEKILSLEQFFIKKKLSLPVGGSLLLVAKRLE